MSAAVCLLVSAQLWAAHQAYETIGEVASFGLYTSVVLSNILVVAFLWVSRALAIATLVLFTVLFVPYQVELTAQMTRTHAEVVRIIEYCQTQQEITGAYPVDLLGYQPNDTTVMPFVSYSTRPSYGYQVGYNVGTPNTSHTYSPVNGWFYYPD